MRGMREGMCGREELMELEEPRCPQCLHWAGEQWQRGSGTGKATCIPPAFPNCAVLGSGFSPTWNELGMSPFTPQEWLELLQRCPSGQGCIPVLGHNASFGLGFSSWSCRAEGAQPKTFPNPVFPLPKAREGPGQASPERPGSAVRVAVLPGAPIFTYIL